MHTNSYISPVDVGNRFFLFDRKYATFALIAFSGGISIGNSSLRLIAAVREALEIRGTSSTISATNSFSLSTYRLYITVFDVEPSSYLVSLPLPTITCTAFVFFRTRDDTKPVI